MDSARLTYRIRLASFIFFLSPGLEGSLPHRMRPKVCCLRRLISVVLERRSEIEAELIE